VNGVTVAAPDAATDTSTPQLTPNATTVLERRYLKKGDDGKPIETPVEMLMRVARNIASADERYPGADVEARTAEFYELLASLKFVPNSPTLMNAGRELQQLSACFVLPIEDDMQSIFEAVKNTAMIHKSGGGTGFSFSRLRPSNDVVQSTKGISSGPVSFMHVFDSATEAIKQGGTRRGANMAVLNVDHPDIETFIHAKEKQDQLNNFNISVAVTDEFMRAVESDGTYDLVNPRTGETVATKNAGAIFGDMVRLAWRYGDPGVIFLDRVNEGNPTPQVGAFESTNPCGEQPLLPYESCNLGSINLAKFVQRDNGASTVEWDGLRKTVHAAVRFLDNVIDMNNFPLPEIKEMTEANRKIGLGVMGWADMLIMLGIPYDSQDALDLAEKVMQFVRDSAHAASAELAAERSPYPNYPGSAHDGTNGRPLRNATTTTIAPTGTISLIAGCSSGIEPLFAVCYSRMAFDSERLVEVNPLFEAMARERGFHSAELMDDIAEHGSIHELYNIPEDVRRLFVTAHDVAPEWHVRMQAAFQKHTDNAVSKTVNFPHDATTEDVDKVYRLAYELDCKGVTIYRDRSRDEQVITFGTADEKKVDDEGRIVPRGRPEVTSGQTRKMITGCGNLYVTINSDDKGMFEVFAAMGKAGGCGASQNEAIARLTSLALRSNVSAETIMEQLRGISCHRPAWDKGAKVLSCADSIAKAIERCLQDGSGAQQQFVFEPVAQSCGRCPDCGGPIEHEGGCESCRVCGYSECG
jgi:ribonucleoside-diphosphate reductase alpha chain